MPAWHRGDLVEIDGLLAAIVGIGGDPGVPEDHVAVWFGDPRGTARTDGGPGGLRPEVWTISSAYVTRAAEPDIRH